METISVKYLFDIFSGSTPDSGKPIYWDGDYNWFTPDDLGKIGTDIYVSESKRKLTDEGLANATLKIAKSNSLIVTKRAPIGNLAISTLPASCNQGCFIFEANEDRADVKFYYYFLLNQTEKLNLLGRGSTFLELSADDMKSFKVPFLPLKEQKTIVRFLDKEILRIDKLIEKKTRLINLLEERDKALAKHILTKGLNNNSLLKSSGIEWLGYIPKHWTVMKLKYISNLKSGDFIQAEDITEDGDFKVYGGNGVRGYFKENNCEGSLVLIGRQGALCGNVNFAYGKFWATEHAIVCHPIKPFDYYWLGRQLELMNLNQYSLAAAQPGLSVEVIKNLFIAVPPIEEQQAISVHLKTLEERSEKFKTKVVASIALLKEKRTALISAAVNGELNLEMYAD